MYFKVLNFKIKNIRIVQIVFIVRISEINYKSMYDVK